MLTRRNPAGARMRRPLLIGVVGTAAALLLTVGTPPVAGAAPRRGPGAECPPGQSNCSVWDGTDPKPGNPGGGGNDDGGGSGGGGRACQRDGEPVPCYDRLLGWFNNADGCYYKLQEPQPPDTPEGKQWYLRSCGNAQDSQLLDAPPDGFGEPPSPLELALQALATITLAAPTVHLAPNKGAGLVGLPVWMWTDEFDEPDASASAGGLTVRIQARVEKVDWKMGDDGPTVRCTTAGTPYNPRVHKGGKSPDCGYRGYPKAGVYRVTATTTWKVTYAGGGEQGTLPLQIRAADQPGTIRIDELQVVTS